MAGVLGLWLSACLGFAGALQAQLLDASPALSVTRLAELKSQAPAAPGKPGIDMVAPFGTSLHVSSTHHDDFPRWLSERDPALAQAYEALHPELADHRIE